jgi:hypothetical protein
MSVIPLTVFFSLLLAGLFMVLFAHEQRRRRFASSERDSLLPLAAERPRLAASPKVARGLQTRPEPVHGPGSTADTSAGGQPGPDVALYF